MEKMAGLPGSRVLDLGCSGGLFAAHARAAGHEVTGVDYLEIPGVRDRTDHFVKASLEEGIPAEVGDGFDIIVAADVIEHLSRPGEILRDMRRVLRPSGQVLLSVPNFAHWYPRSRVAMGLFGYDRRGILDETHLRFFTRADPPTAGSRRGFDILEEQATGLPLGAISEADGRKLRLARSDRQDTGPHPPDPVRLPVHSPAHPARRGNGTCGSHLRTGDQFRPGRRQLALAGATRRPPAEHRRPDGEDTSRRHHLTIGSLALLLLAVGTAAVGQVMLKHGMQVASARVAQLARLADSERGHLAVGAVRAR